MNSGTRTYRTRLAGFTLVELLVVIAIIATLAGLILPAVMKSLVQAKEAKARTEMRAIEAAIKQYQTSYGRFPVSAQAEKSTDATACPDFTFGTVDAGGNLVPTQTGPARVSISNTGNNGYQNSNAEVMAILLALERDGYGNATVNLNNVRNPRKEAFLNAKRATGNTQPGIGDDLIYRDPWGNPYLITLDLNYDNKCRDAFYRLAAVSLLNGNQGINGLSRSVTGDNFEANTDVMVWSLGKDGVASTGVPANDGVNKDNLLTWK